MMVDNIEQRIGVKSLQANKVRNARNWSRNSSKYCFKLPFI